MKPLLLALPILLATLAGAQAQGVGVQRLAWLQGCWASAGTDRVVEEPQTPEEIVLRRIWARLLHREDIGRDDSFFGLGGHSLLVVRLSAELTRVFRFPVQLRVLFDHPTLASMAQAVGDTAPKPGQARKIAELVLRIEAERAAATGDAPEFRIG